MPTWKRANPKHQPLKCCAEFHLWERGLVLAIYSKAGALTIGGDASRTFFANATTLSKFFGCHNNSATNAIKYLTKHGWFKPTAKKRHFIWVSHEEWAKTPRGQQCVERDLMPYQEEADPFISQLWAIAKGKLRLAGPHIIVGLKKLGTEERILEMFANEMMWAEHRKKNGDHENTRPDQCLYVVKQKLMAMQREGMRELILK